MNLSRSSCFVFTSFCFQVQNFSYLLKLQAEENDIRVQPKLNKIELSEIADNLSLSALYSFRFISASRSPTGKPMLVVCGSVSGTVAFLEVTDADDNSDGDNTGDDSMATHFTPATNLVVAAVILFNVMTNALY